jgi:uncharacterized protein YcfL
MRKIILIVLLLIMVCGVCSARIKTEEDKVWGGRSFRVEKVLTDRAGGQSSVKETITFEKIIKSQATYIYIGYDLHGYYYQNQGIPRATTQLKQLSYRIEGSDKITTIDVVNPESASKQDVVYLTGQFILTDDDISKITNAEKIYFEILYLTNKAVTFTIDGGTLSDWKEVIKSK